MQWFGNQQILKSLVVINEGDITWIKKYEEKKKKKTRAPKAYTPEMAVYARVCARVCTHSQVTS